MSDKELFLLLLESKDLYKVFIDNDGVYFVNKEELEEAEEDWEFSPDEHNFKEYGYHLLNEIF